MKFLVCADIHFHNWSQFSTPVETPYGVLNSRFYNTLKAFEQMCDYAIGHHIFEIFIVGDLFHTRGVINVEVYNTVKKVLNNFKERGIKFYIVAGNHDQTTRHGIHTSLYGLSDVATIFENHEIKDFNNYYGREYYAFIPFAENPEVVSMQFLNAQLKANIVFAHIGVAGAVVGVNEYAVKEPVNLDSLCIPDFGFVFLGHYHKHQMLQDNCCYVGSLVQNNFADEGNLNGFIEYNTKNQKIKFVELSDIPKFITVKCSTQKELDSVLKKVKSDYYCIVKPDSLKSVDHPNVIFKNEPEVDYVQRIKDIAKLSDEEIFLKYCQLRDKVSESLIQIGKEFIKKGRELC